MMPEPPPKVQKSANTLWPLSAISQYHDGDGAPSKAGRVASSGGTTPSIAPARKKLGRSG